MRQGLPPPRRSSSGTSTSCASGPRAAWTCSSRPGSTEHSCTGTTPTAGSSARGRSSCSSTSRRCTGCRPTSSSQTRDLPEMWRRAAVAAAGLLAGTVALFLMGAAVTATVAARSAAGEGGGSVAASRRWCPTRRHVLLRASGREAVPLVGRHPRLLLPRRPRCGVLAPRGRGRSHRPSGSAPLVEGGYPRSDRERHFLGSFCPCELLILPARPRPAKEMSTSPTAGPFPDSRRMTRSPADFLRRSPESTWRTRGELARTARTTWPWSGR